MRRLALALLFAAMFTSSAVAADQYEFQVRLTDGKSALLANPDYATLGISPEQLERAANDRVVMLDRTSGTRWRWLMLSWLEEKPDVEQTIATRGAAPRESADLALSAGARGHFRVRCLREECSVRVTPADGDAQSVTLKRGEQSGDLPSGSRVALSFR